LPGTEISEVHSDFPRHSAPKPDTGSSHFKGSFVFHRSFLVVSILLKIIRNLALGKAGIGRKFWYPGSTVRAFNEDKMDALCSCGS